MVVNKTEIAKEIAMEMDISERTASKMITTVFDYIIDMVAEGNEVLITDFGKFYKAEVKERTVFGYTTPAHMVPKFKAGKAFKDAVS